MTQTPPGFPPVASAVTFNRDAAGYDALRRGLIPCFDAFYGTVLDLIADWGPPARPAVLDLGAGTGLLSAMVLDLLPDARLRLVDSAQGMLDQARARFPDRPEVSYATADMATADLGGPWDVVISALAIHHLDHAAKRALFARIRAALAPGGLFVNAEQVLGPDAASDARNVRNWQGAIVAAGVTPAEAARAAERMAHDICAPVEDQLAWMRDAGFVAVDCAFKAWRFAVLTGRAESALPSPAAPR